MRRLAAPTLAVACGALLAALAAFVALPRGPRSALIEVPHDALRPPILLAQAAAQPPTLRPIVIRAGRWQLGTGPAGSVAANRPAPPARLSIPSIGVDAPVDPVHGTAVGIDVPAVGRAGWYDAGPRPGEPGRAVIIGHFDASNGPGLFALLPAVATGTKIAVSDSAGAVHHFMIVGRAQIEKSKFPTYAVYGPAPRPVLVLVTCGGPYIPGVGYRDNVIVYARSVD